jgi:asparagine synthase (glutamine-hydrolysing)
MCGIFLYIGREYTETQLIRAAQALAPRGPDSFGHWTRELADGRRVFMGFQRLAIMDLSESGNQPMIARDDRDDRDLVLIANGEIYNHAQISEGHVCTSTSDCESIFHAYEHCTDPDKGDAWYSVPNELDGVFAYALYDGTRGTVQIARDPLGVRPLFMCSDADAREWIFASEMKAIHALTGAGTQGVRPFPPGHVMTVQLANMTAVADPYWEPMWHAITLEVSAYEEALTVVKRGLTDAVRKRLMSDRPIGCLLSGGLDSSLVAALVQRCMRETHPDFQLHTFSIGMEGATDLAYAQAVADHIGSIHHEVHFTPEEGIAVIPELIAVLESFDVTTVRASVGMYLLSKWISENTDVKVIFSGEGADELAQGYIYFHNAPTPADGHEESLRLLGDLYMYDVLRADRTISHFGLEARVPFLDKTFVSSYLNIAPELRHISGHPDPSTRMEKHLIRCAFADPEIIPASVLWRRKEAFSDGVSSMDPARAWHRLLTEHADLIISDLEYDCALEDRNKEIMKPYSKEQYWYWKCFRNTYPRVNYAERQELIPYIWMPKWSDTQDPSARMLTHY